MGAYLCSDHAQKQPFRRSEQNLAAAFYYGTVTLPPAHQATCGEGRDIRRICQLFVCDLQEHITRRFFADRPGQSNEYLSNPLSRRMAG